MTNSVWRFNESGNDLGSAWKEPGYNDSGWRSGRGVLAREDQSMVKPLTYTVLALTNASGQHILTYYFRTRFSFSNDPQAFYLVFTNLVDDGAVVYLNGRELYRCNMPAGTLSASTLALDAATEGVFTRVIAPSGALVRGDNVLAVEVHQNSATSSDVVFGMSVNASLLDQGPFAIIEHPQSQAVKPGGTAAFSPLIVGEGPLVYQWRFNGTAIPGATNRELEIHGVSISQDGFYSLRVADLSGAVVSAPARLKVDAAGLLPFHSESFESGAGFEWSRPVTEKTPIGGRRFLGRFTNETVTLSLTNLPPHTNITVALEFFAIGSWDGSRGDDLWEMSVGGGVKLLRGMFQVHVAYSSQPFPHQSFPDPYLEGTNAAFTGASEIRSLGYSYNGEPDDAVYQLVYSCGHTNDSIRLNFTGLTDEPIDNESWGIDNFKLFLNEGRVTGLNLAASATDGLVRVKVTRCAPRAVVLESSADWKAWSSVATNTSANGQVEFVLPTSPQQHRFFRANQ